MYDPRHPFNDVLILEVIATVSMLAIYVATASRRSLTQRGLYGKLANPSYV